MMTQHVTPQAEVTPEVSIAIAVRNEEACVVQLLEEIDEVLSVWDHTFEVVIADDGSTDRTPILLQELKAQFPYLRCFRLPVGQSKSAGLAVAVLNSRGATIVTMDGDLQNDPRDIPTLVQHAGPKTLVCGARPKRADTIFKRSASKIANAIRRGILDDEALDSGCGVKVFPREAANDIPWIRGVHRFIAAVLKERGYRIVNVPINDRLRTMGMTKYGNWGRLKRTLPDLFGFRWLLSRKLNLDAKEM